MATKIKLSELRNIIKEEVAVLKEGGGYTSKNKLGATHAPDEGSSGVYAVMDFIYDLPKLLAVSKTLHVFQGQDRGINTYIVALNKGVTPEDYIKAFIEENVGSWENFLKYEMDQLNSPKRDKWLMDRKQEYKKDPKAYIKELQKEFNEEAKHNTLKLIKTIQFA